MMESTRVFYQYGKFTPERWRGYPSHSSIDHHPAGAKTGAVVALADFDLDSID